MRTVAILVFTPLLGILFALGQDDWTWFARFGSIMVAISVLVFALAYLTDAKTAVGNLVVSPFLQHFIVAEIFITQEKKDRLEEAWRV